MSEEEDRARTVRETHNALAERASQFESGRAATILPPARSPAPIELQRIQLAARTQPGTLESGLQVGATLGEGGMGVVREAMQLRLGRKVAIKTLRGPTAGGDDAGLKLLREAWAAAAIEHPNIVPVHDVGWSSDGQPIIVFKHIEGVRWAELMGDEAEIGRRFHRSRLDWNLGVLVQVCNAIAFAHSRGIVHRDLKPDNIMIGAFGEVCVLDWGIAVATRDTGRGLPLAEHATELAGTPSYMAPEMLGRAPSRISERTDVYLLGAVIFEIISDRPPHHGERLLDMITSILGPEPPLPSYAPVELAAICRRAMRPNPDDRYESVEALRRALEAYMDHRASTALADAAAEQLRSLTELLSRGTPSDPRERRRVADLFGACRFGFGEALRGWQDNQAAREGLRAAVEIMCDYELRVGELRAAEVLFLDLQAPPTLLRAALEAARQAERDKAAELAVSRLRSAERDPGLGRRARLIAVAVMCVIWTLAPLAQQFVLAGTVTYSFLLLSTVVSVVTLGAFGWYWRVLITKSVFNRWLLLLAAGAQVVNAITWIGQAMLGLDPLLGEILTIPTWLAIFVSLAIVMHPGLVAPAVATGASFLLSVAYPHMLPTWVSCSNLVLCVTLLLIWRARRDDD